MTRGIPYLIHEIVKLCFQNNITLSIETVFDEKGKNKIDRSDDKIIITVYASNEDNEEFAANLDILADSLRTTAL